MNLLFLGIHAREWIAVATATFIAKEIIQAHLKSEPWASRFDWYIAPCINPDGYEYSHTSVCLMIPYHKF